MHGSNQMPFAEIGLPVNGEPAGNETQEALIAFKRFSDRNGSRGVVFAHSSHGINHAEQILKVQFGRAGNVFTCREGEGT